MTLNKQLASIYKKHYLDIRKLLVASYDPAQATDASDYAHDVPPTSLRLVQRQGTLSSAIGPADTTFTVKVTEGQLSAGCLLNIDTGANAETTVITSVSGNTVTVVRGFAGAQTSHAAGVAVEQTDYIHLNAQGYQVVADAVAEYFSAYEASK
jgi:lysophospholipase L1-like esterase